MRTPLTWGGNALTLVKKGSERREGVPYARNNNKNRLSQLAVADLTPPRKIVWYYPKIGSIAGPLSLSHTHMQTIMLTEWVIQEIKYLQGLLRR